MAMGSGGEIIHCEIIFENYGFQIGSSWNPTGTEIKHYANRNHNNWLYYNIGTQHEAQMHDYISKQVHKGYTLAGLFTNMIMNLNFGYKNKSFCSELCFDTLKYAGGITLPNINGSSVSPNELHRMILGLGFTQVYL